MYAVSPAVFPTVVLSHYRHFCNISVVYYHQHNLNEFNDLQLYTALS